ncbi:MAG: hypothetical protein PUD02_03205, partial [Eggerthellales bacterium]|nr:hypothetical protein [Eggerthellales bacterium]
MPFGSRLLETDNYTVPVVDPKSTVPRPRLLDLIDAAFSHPVTLVYGPAGCGKTTAVAMWCARRGLKPTWITLDAADADPVRFAQRFAQGARMHTGVSVKAAPVETDLCAVTTPTQTAAYVPNQYPSVYTILDHALASLQSLEDDCVITLDGLDPVLD